MAREYRERLQYQLRFHVDPKRFKTAAARAKAVSQARAHFINTGKEIKGVRIEARWRNPDNKNPKHVDWKTTSDRGQGLFDFWKTLGKGRGALR